MKLVIILLFSIFSQSWCAYAYSYESNCRKGGNTALIIIDMQEDFINRFGSIDNVENQQKFENLIENQLIAIRNAKRANIPIVLVEDFSCENCFQDEITPKYCLQQCVKSKSLPVLIAELDGYEKLQVLKKNYDGLFYFFQSYFNEAIEFLVDYDIGKMIFMGANGGSCVKKTIRNALEEQKCDVVAFTKGIIDFNYDNYIYPYRAKNEYGFMYIPSMMSYPSYCSECTFDIVSDHEVLKKHF